MKKTFLTLSIISLLFSACEEDKDPFLINTNGIGSITKETKIRQLDSIFENDSLVKIPEEANRMSNMEQFEIYEKGGQKLLLITPQKSKDPEARINNVQVFDERYKTENGLTINSTFKEVKEKYTISSIVNTMRSIVISLEGTDVYITIDKEVLPDAIKYQFGSEVKATDIPDDAKIKFFMIGWESNE
ncbi:hypothetical protein [Planktosalinus lacus]|uniref:Lipoprotein n=1 Tax=Planktosalinus lacus TaxID=1526573 RepID=A0A8J2VDY1_9FLAO|nr:hypothetical protein [Planktosalinus lacus]GGE01122.1 hypothetical protein GCM10011312_25720 [Planktosalinus lacus]